LLASWEASELPRMMSSPVNDGIHFHALSTGERSKTSSGRSDGLHELPDGHYQTSYMETYQQKPFRRPAIDGRKISREEHEDRWREWMRLEQRRSAGSMVSAGSSVMPAGQRKTKALNTQICGKQRLAFFGPDVPIPKHTVLANAPWVKALEGQRRALTPRASRPCSTYAESYGTVDSRKQADTCWEDALNSGALSARACSSTQTELTQDRDYEVLSQKFPLSRPLYSTLTPRIHAANGHRGAPPLGSATRRRILSSDIMPLRLK